jgi:N utilization substance protein B
MKTAKDPRHQKRRAAVKKLFAQSFTKQANLSGMAKKIYDQRKQIDKKIHEAAPAWPIEKLNRIDLAILRLAVYELEKVSTPPKVVIDESVELAKEFGSENSPSFINGVLGTIYTKVEDKMDEPKGNKEDKVSKETILNLLAQQLGVEAEDIKESDSLTDDLHMKASDVVDFTENLAKLEQLVSESNLE